jgi:pyruvate dehydrogenase E2 component (dihydrolipoamide acetyltransferase)
MARFRPLERPSSFRKIAAAVWRPPNDPTIYGTMSIEMTGAQRFLAAERERTGLKLTVTHLVARAVALAFRRHPDLNAKVRWGRILLRDSVDLFLQVSTDNGADLSGAKIERADEKGLADIARELSGTAGAIREGRDPALKKSRGLISRLPWFLVGLFLRIGDFLTNTLHIDLRGSGMPRDPFGTCMVTSVGMFGIEVGYAPFIPMARCPAIILVGEVQDRPWVVDGKLEVRPVIQLSATFDHRIIDGYHAGLLAREMRTLLSAPEQLA